MADSTALEAARARNTAQNAMTARSMAQRYLRRRGSKGPWPPSATSGPARQRHEPHDFSDLRVITEWAACQIGKLGGPAVPRDQRLRSRLVRRRRRLDRRRRLAAALLLEPAVDGARGDAEQLRAEAL